MLIRLAVKSLLNRKESVLLACVAMTISIFVLLGVDHIRKQAKESFSSTVSGVDMIVGARSGSINLLVYTVFRMGSPVNNISWSTYQDISSRKEVAWTIPISLGDSHRGFRVLGTNLDYFKHFQYGNRQKIQFSEGEAFKQTFDVVLGASVASSLNYQLGDAVVLSHGVGETSFNDHSNHPFTVTGILSATGTPIDQTVHVQLSGIEAIHAEPGQTTEGLEPSSITAFMVGLNSKLATFRLQRDVNDYRAEALSAILPGVALTELWSTMAILEGTLQLVSSLVLVAALFGMSAMMAATLRERRQELSLLRIIGARPMFLFILFQIEAFLITVLSLVCGAALLFLSLLATQKFIAVEFGLHMEIQLLTPSSILIAVVIIAASFVLASLPALLAYREGR